MRTSIIIIGFLITSVVAFGQSSKLKKADNYYDHLAYAYAAPLYEELTGSSYDNPKLQSKLATSYFHMGNMQRAEECFENVVNTNEATDQDIFFYAQALKQNGNYQKSDEWMQKFHQRNAKDARANSYVQEPNYLTEIEKKGEKFEIKNLNVNSDASDFGGYPSIDGKTSYFVSARRKTAAVKSEFGWNSRRFLDLYSSTVGSDQEMTDPQLVSKKVNTKFHEGPMCFTRDGGYVYFTRNNIAKGSDRKDDQGIQNLKLYRSRVDDNGKWVDELVLPFNSRDYSVGHPSVSPDGKILYFVSDMPGGFGGADLYKVDVSADGTLGTPVNMGSQFNTEGHEMFPWISEEGHLFFSSNGHIGMGGLDVFVAMAKRAGGFGKIVNVGKPVNSNKDDFAFTMNSDNKTGYFSSNRGNGKGDDDIYSFVLAEPFKKPLIVEGVISDQRNNEILPLSEVKLLDEKGDLIASTFSDEKGAYTFDVEPERDYTVTAKKDDFQDNLGSFTTKNLPKDVDVVRRDVPLDKTPKFSLYALVTDAKTKQPLEGVTLRIIDNITGEEFIQAITPTSGDALKGIEDRMIGDPLSYTIKLSKDGYYPKTVSFESEIKKPGVINVHEALAGGLELEPEGALLSKMVEINPIFFDFDKYNIRPDAQVELNKLVKIMNQYPKMEIEIGSHTDCRANEAYNRRLSENRARSSASYVKAKISNPARIYGKGYGESRMITDCPCEPTNESNCSEDQHQLNRRTEFVVIKTGSDDLRIVGGTVPLQGGASDKVVKLINEDTYTIKTGETLYRVYVNTGVPVDQLKRLNNLTSNNIKVGQVIKLR